MRTKVAGITQRFSALAPLPSAVENCQEQQPDQAPSRQLMSSDLVQIAFGEIGNAIAVRRDQGRGSSV